MSLPLVSVVVLNYNGRNLLKKCLSSILSQNYPNFEVIFVDNGSKDMSLLFVRAEYGKDARLRLVENGANLGVSEGHNVGIRQAKGKYVVFFDNDTWLEEECLEKLVARLELDHTIGAAQAKLLIADKPHLLDCTGGFVDYNGITCERGHLEKDIDQFEDSDEIFYCKLSAMIVRASVLQAVGELDSDYFIHYDETDLCWRIWLRGYRLVYVPKAIVHHRTNYTITSLGLNQTYFLTRNCALSIIKNYELKNLVLYLPFFYLLETTRALKHLLKKQIGLGFALLGALMWNLTNLKRTLWKRSIVQNRIRRVSDKELMERIMIKPIPLPLRLLFRKYRILKYWEK